VVEIREVLRAWLAGYGVRWWPPRPGWIERLPVAMSRRRWRRAWAGGIDQLDDALIGAVVTVVRPDRTQGFGTAWEVLCANHDQINKWVDNGLTVVKIGDMLARQGVLVPAFLAVAVQRALGQSIGAVSGRERCPWSTASPAWNARSISPGWACCSIPRRAVAGWCMR
jgi:hypothetical protein